MENEMTEKKRGCSKIKAALEQSFKDIDKVAIFIDGHTTLDSLKSLNLKIDWEKVGDLFRYLCRINTINFYLSNSSSRADTSTDLKPLSNWLAHNGFKVIHRTGHHFNFIENSIVDSAFEKTGYKTGYDIDIVSDILSLADKVDKIVLFSSNNDFCPMVEALQSKGVPVVLFSNSLNRMRKLKEAGKISSPGNIGVNLIRSTNEFFELDDLREEIEVVVTETA